MFRTTIFILLAVILGSTAAHAAPRKEFHPHNPEGYQREIAPTPAEPTYEERLAQDREKVYQQGKALSDAGNYPEALDIFEDAARQYPKDPDILNMLAFCQRKTGRTGEAIANYNRALSWKPHFPEAREYLTAAYVQAALKEIETLKSYGSEAAEEYEDAVKELKEAAEHL